MQEKLLEELLKDNKYLRPKDKNILRTKLLEEQNYKCKICSKPLEHEKNTNRHIDHSHKSKLVRGILCMTCNTILGKIERAGYSIEWLQLTGEYLKTGTHPIIFPEKITAKRKTKKDEMKKLINVNTWNPKGTNQCQNVATENLNPKKE